MSATLMKSRRLVWSGGFVVVIVAIAGIALLLRPAAMPVAGFVEYRMTQTDESPIAITAAPDGSVWFASDQSDSLGRIRDGHIDRVPTGSRNVEPIGLAVTRDGAAWFTDMLAGAVARVSPDGAISRFRLETPIVRLGRLAAAPDGSLWFAEATGYSVTQLKDGNFTRHEMESTRGGPYGVAIAPDGTVWATIQAGNQLMHVAGEGRTETFDIPRHGAVPTDIAVGADGTVWFIEFRGNQIGAWRDGTFTEAAVPGDSAGLSGLAVAPDGTVWFGMVRAGSLGRLRGGKVDVVKLPRAEARPYTLTADQAGNVWYADLSGYVGMLKADDASR